MMLIFRDHNKGIIGTAIFHIILLLILLFVTFAPVEPTFPDPDGIVIDFGDSETGMGEVEPSVDEPNVAEAQPQEVVPEEVSEPEPTTDPVVDEQPIATQDYIEDAPSVEEIALKKKKEQEEQERLKQKQVEEERIRLEKLAEEKRKQEEQERQLAEAKRIEEINNKTKSLFGGANGSTTSSSQGVAGGSGNQGNPDGEVNANNYIGGGKGHGIDYSLDGRSVVSLPHPKKGIQDKGKVVVQIIVNQNGDVISANPGVTGSMTMNGDLLEAAKEAALKAKFNVNPNAPERQKGTITYIFELQ